jgi:Uma2 family endonuclease
MATTHDPRPLETGKKLRMPAPLRWSRSDYYRLGHLGFFQGRRVELIHGEILEMSPPEHAHSASVTLVADALRAVFGSGYWVRSEQPLDLGKSQQPQPDVSVVVGGVREHKAHPTSAALVVEVSDSTLAYDRGRRASIYARAGIADYWIVNLVDRQLEVYRLPEAVTAPGRSYSYQDVTIVPAAGHVSPLAAPKAIIKVAELIP